MTTPATPSGTLAALYAERADRAYYLMHEEHLPARLDALERDYADLHAEIATLEAQWPARWVRPEAGGG